MMQEDLEAYIYEHIPIVKKNNFKVVQTSSGIEVFGDYLEHINHRNSVFGGSIGTALTLVAWAYSRSLMKNAGFHDAINVIQSQSVQFLRPVTRDFVARVLQLPQAEIEKSLAIYQKFGKARFKVDAVLCHLDDDAVLANFVGEFVVVRPK